MKYKVSIIIIAAILAAGIAGSAFVLTAPAGDTVRIVSGGTVIETFSLSSAADRIFDVEYDGHINTIEIKDHRIKVKSADCPDQTCVRMGVLSSAAAPIVCLPHHLVIEYTSASDGVDAVTR